MILDTPIEYLKGVGPARGELLKRELEISTYRDLLEYYPFRHIDRSRVETVDSISLGESYVVLRGVVDELRTISNGRQERLTARFRDETGTIELVWFQGLKWVKETIRADAEYLVMGKPTEFNGHINIAHPDMERIGIEERERLKYIPIYSTTEKLKSKGLTSKGIARLTEQLLGQVRGKVPEVLPQAVLSQYRLPSRGIAIEVIHYPNSQHDYALSLQRMKFEELFMLQLENQYAKQERMMRSRGNVCSKVGTNFHMFYRERLPFELTGAQKRVIKEIRADMGSGRQMNRLLQGDVGSGKTLVALMCMLIGVDNGYQCCLMAPTEILAQQHYATITKLLGEMELRVGLLTGSTKSGQKRTVKSRLKNNDIDILIGTHALIEKDVEFANLGFVVIDEQHRFGVEQRSKLWKKSAIAPHVLVMTATPIPRTLAMTLYGDLDCSVIDELPPGRKPVKTVHYTDAHRLQVFGFIRRQIAEGRQVYIVYPLIEESERMDLKDLMDGYESVSREFPMPDYQISIVHGQMTSEAKEYEMERFKRGETQIMVSTTVIEVGVDVPNATVMVIENAERFGLSQLHQLRGRVGRGGSQSYCILMTKEQLSTNGRERIGTMVETNDGFRIAEADLKLRGPGDIQGLQQSGILQLKLADIVEDEPIVKAARESVQQILEEDPTLSKEEHRCLMEYLRENRKGVSWGKIS